MSDVIKFPNRSFLGMWVTLREWEQAVEDLDIRREAVKRREEIIRDYTKNFRPAPRPDWVDPLPYIVGYRLPPGPSEEELAATVAASLEAVAAFARDGFDQLINEPGWTAKTLHAMKNNDRGEVRERSRWVHTVWQCRPRETGGPVAVVETEPTERQRCVADFLAKNPDATIRQTKTGCGGVSEGSISEMECWRTHRKAKEARKEANRKPVEVALTSKRQQTLQAVPGVSDDEAETGELLNTIRRKILEVATGEQRAKLTKLRQHKPTAISELVGMIEENWTLYENGPELMREVIGQHLDNDKFHIYFAPFLLPK